jgi:hypothetical protein
MNKDDITKVIGGLGITVGITVFLLALVFCALSMIWDWSLIYSRLALTAMFVSGVVVVVMVVFFLKDERPGYDKNSKKVLELAEQAPISQESMSVVLRFDPDVVRMSPATFDASPDEIAKIKAAGIEIEVLPPLA